MSSTVGTARAEDTLRSTILIVDDEPAQRETIRRGLFLYGFDSVVAESAELALAILQDAKSPTVDLLVTDVTTRGASGCELIAAVRRMRPGLPVLIITGLSLDPRIIAEARARGVRVLRKPFGPDELDSAVRAMLASR